MKNVEQSLSFFISTRFLPVAGVIVPLYVLFSPVGDPVLGVPGLGLLGTLQGLIILYTAFNLSFSVWLMKGFIDDNVARNFGGDARGRTFEEIIRALLFLAAAVSVLTSLLFGLVPALQGSRTTVSNVNGDYSFPAIPPGDYTVKFEMEGMSTVSRTSR